MHLETPTRSSQQDQPDQTTFLPFDTPPVTGAAFDLDPIDRPSTRSRSPSPRRSFGPFSSTERLNITGSGRHSAFMGDGTFGLESRRTRHGSLQLPIMAPPMSGKGESDDDREQDVPESVPMKRTPSIIAPRMAVHPFTSRSTEFKTVDLGTNSEYQITLVGHPFLSGFFSPSELQFAPPPPLTSPSSTTVDGRLSAKQKLKMYCPIMAWCERRRLAKALSLQLLSTPHPPALRASTSPPIPKRSSSSNGGDESPVPRVEVSTAPRIQRDSDRGVRDGSPSMPLKYTARDHAPTRPPMRSELSVVSLPSEEQGLKLRPALATQVQPDVLHYAWMTQPQTSLDISSSVPADRRVPRPLGRYSTSSIKSAVSRIGSTSPATAHSTKFLQAKLQRIRPSTAPESTTPSISPPRLEPRSARAIVHRAPDMDGMTALGFLALGAPEAQAPAEGEGQARVSMDLHDRTSVDPAGGHIIPPSELAQVNLRRSLSVSSAGEDVTPSPQTPGTPTFSARLGTPTPTFSIPFTPATSPAFSVQDNDIDLGAWKPHYSARPPHRPSSARSSSKPWSSTPLTSIQRVRPAYPQDVPDTPTTSDWTMGSDSPEMGGCERNAEREMARKRLTEWLASKPRRTGQAGLEVASSTSPSPGRAAHLDDVGVDDGLGLAGGEQGGERDEQEEAGGVVG